MPGCRLIIGELSMDHAPSLALYLCSKVKYNSSRPKGSAIISAPKPALGTLSGPLDESHAPGTAPA
eukprot:scaffold110298_cov18-Tisochrysis_lutea.AAC.1